MNILKEKNLVVRIPELTARYRGNCSKEWGLFVTGETKGMKCSDAEKKGLTFGDSVDLALCYVENKKILTFGDNYTNEPFTEIWGIPVAGEMKNRFPENASELITFLIHRQSKDKFKAITEVVNRSAFNSWVEGGMKGDPDAFVIESISNFFFNNIFNFKFVYVSGKNHYYYLETTYREPQNELEKSALVIAKKLYDLQNEGNGYCTDPRIEDNHMKCLLSLNELKAA
jgi:hypothetical protein